MREFNDVRWALAAACLASDSQAKSSWCKDMNLLFVGLGGDLAGPIRKKANALPGGLVGFPVTAGIWKGSVLSAASDTQGPSSGTQEQMVQLVAKTTAKGQEKRAAHEHVRFVLVCDELWCTHCAKVCLF